MNNIADVLKTSPSLLERYMAASWNISRVAVGDPSIIADSFTYRAKPDLSQEGHMDGLPLGTRGGLMVRYNFPLDGEYVFRIRLWRATAELIKGLEGTPHQIELSVDGQRIKVITVGGKEDQALGSTQTPASPPRKSIRGSPFGLPSKPDPAP